jgi:hypothetical protein
MNFVTAMPRFASIAAMIAVVPEWPCSPDGAAVAAGAAVDGASAGHGDASLARRDGSGASAEVLTSSSYGPPRAAPPGGAARL